MTLVRIWRTRIDLDRLDEYERFVHERSAPMFQAQQGFVGVVFSRSEDEVAVISFWRDRAAVDALDGSATYQAAVQAIAETGFLVGDADVRVYDVDAATGLGL
jgi:heme-degrading monooxygenase HmoA